ncbi:tyrosine-type recombinase/integrase [Neorhizobium sp. T786]|uniref:tyrosine-type recombinase/integrase n=1 Tax=Pseudorhizobium xiangyangii TaxID=2883104 RepID=UPI001CFFD939|nr:tyrosine-type recombinase/integrase [Neorhizobium xiangyangii]MCB5203520.1 tyrosine-type recombinase/integrase [Neorhizobium xiangyangii]
MPSHQNAFVIYDYQTKLKQAQGLDDKTIDAALRHIRQFEEATGNVDFSQVSRDQIIAYKNNMQTKAEEEGTLSASTVVHSLGTLKAFFLWLSKQFAFTKMPRDLPDYFTPSKRLAKIAKAATEKHVPTADEIRMLIAAAPANTVLQRRDRAMIAFLYLTGVRDGALVTLRVKHVDTSRKLVFQDAKRVATKASKTMRTAWFPVGEDIEKTVIDWLEELRDLGAQDNDPLFPRGFKKHWGELKEVRFDFLASAAPVRHVMKAAAEAAGTKYSRPHAIRSTIARMIERWGATAEERKALSQNLGHEDYRTTLVYYGALDEDHQHALVESIRNRGEVDPHLDILQPFSKAPDNIRTAMFALLEPYR